VQRGNSAKMIAFFGSQGFSTDAGVDPWSSNSPVEEHASSASDPSSST